MSLNMAALQMLPYRLTIGLKGVHSDNTVTLKHKIPEWLTKDKAALVPPLELLKSKAYHGFTHPVFAKLLTLMETWMDILDGTRHIKSDHLLAFLFLLHQEFPVKIEDLEDNTWIMVLDNALKGEVPLQAWVVSVTGMLLTLHQAAKVIFMGPDATLEGNRYHKGCPGNASIIGLVTFTPWTIMRVVVQVYFALLSKQDWYKTEGDHFSYKKFFWMICSLFDDKEWGNKIIALWNKLVLGTIKVAALVAAACGPSSLERVKAVHIHKCTAVAPASNP
ncbi:hypothetical protein B0H14DRAFT_3507172 [Mycena olivaceomarginata]|nr:hypothetical protein B0H14DRAFT_3507172 [Mycena olivaceomarginata]